MYVRNWCFTSYKMPNILDTGYIQYYIYQEEECPSTKRRHWQGYIEFKDKQSIRGIKLLFNDMTIHLEPRKGTQEQAIAYCSKLDTRIKEPVIFGVPKKQGKRSDIEEIMQDIEEGATMKEILIHHRGNALRMIHCIERAMISQHDLSMLDQYILIKRKRNKDKLDEKLEDDYEKKLFR